MAHNSNYRNPTAKKEKQKPSNITISTGSQVFITLGSYHQINSGLQTANAKNDNADNSLHFIDTKKKTPTNNAYSTYNYFNHQNKIRPVSGSSGQNNQIKNFFNQKNQQDIQTQIQNKQQRLYSPNNVISNNGPGETSNLLNVASGVSGGPNQTVNMVHDALNMSNRYIAAQNQYPGACQNQNNAVVKIQKATEKITYSKKFQKKQVSTGIQVPQKQSLLNHKHQAINENQMSQITNQNQLFHNLNESSIDQFSGQDQQLIKERAQIFKNQHINNRNILLTKNNQKSITEEYSTRNEGTECKTNTSGICNQNQSFQFGLGTNFGQQIFQGPVKQNRGGSSGSTNNAKNKFRSGSNKINLIQNKDMKSITNKKKITINTNPGQILMEQQTLNRGVLTSKNTTGTALNFKHLPTHKQSFKIAITPGGFKNNLTKKGLIIQTSSHLPTKKVVSAQQTKTICDHANQASKSSNKEGQMLKHQRNGEVINRKVGHGYKLQNNNIFNDGFNYIKEREPKTTKNISPKDQHKYTINGKKFNLDNDVFKKRTTSSDKHKSMNGHSNILKLKIQMMQNQINEQNQQRALNGTKASPDIDHNSFPRSNKQGESININTSFNKSIINQASSNGPFTVKNKDGNFQNLIDLKVQEKLKKQNSNNASQKKYKTIAEDNTESNIDPNMMHSFEQQKEKISQNNFINFVSQSVNQQFQQASQKSNHQIIPKLTQKQVQQYYRIVQNDQKQEETKKKVTYQSGHNSRNVSQRMGDNVVDSKTINDSKSIVFLKNGSSKMKVTNKSLNVKNQKVQVKSAERTSKNIINNILCLQDMPSKEHKSNQSKTQQPHNKIIDKLKIGFQKMLLANQTRHNQRLNVNDHTQNISCEVNDLKSVGSTRSNVNRNNRQMQQLNIKNINNNFQNMSYFKRDHQITGQKSTKSNQNQNAYLKDEHSMSPKNLMSITKSNLNPQTKGQFKYSTSIHSNHQGSQQKIVKIQNPKIVSKQIFINKNQMQSQYPQKVIKVQQQNIPAAQPLNPIVLNNRLVSQYTLNSLNSSKDSMYQKLKLQKKQTVQQSMPDLNMGLNEKDNINFKEEDELIQDYQIPQIKKEKVSHHHIDSMDTKKRKSADEQIKVKSKPNSQKMHFYEQELKKRDLIVRFLCQKMEGMESQINLLTKKQKICGSSFNDSKEQKLNESQQSPLNFSKQHCNSINLDGSNLFVQKIKGLIKTCKQQSSTNDQTDPSIKKQVDASMSQQRTAFLLRCMQLHSKQSKSKTGSLQEDDKQFEHLLDQYTDGGLQQIISLVNRNSEEDGENYSQNEAAKNTLLDTYAKHGKEQELAEILSSFEMQKEQHEFLNQAFADIQPLEIEAAPEERTNQVRQNKFKAIEQGISSLQNKLNEFNNFNGNAKRIAELRRYCATSITHTTKTISGGISSRLLKSGSNSGGQSKNKTTARHYQSTSNLDQNSLITVANGELNPNIMNGQVAEYYRVPSASNQLERDDLMHLLDDDQPSNHVIKEGLQDTNLSNILSNTQVQPLCMVDNYQKTEEDEDIKELEGLMNQQYGSMSKRKSETLLNQQTHGGIDETENQQITDSHNLYRMLEKEWLKTQQGEDEPEEHTPGEVGRITSKNQNQQPIQNSQPSCQKDLKAKMKFNQTQKFAVRQNIIGNVPQCVGIQQSGTAPALDERPVPPRKQARYYNNEMLKIQLKQGTPLEQQEENIFYKTQSDSEAPKQMLMLSQKKPINSTEDNSVDAIDQDDLTKSARRVLKKLKTQNMDQHPAVNVGGHNRAQGALGTALSTKAPTADFKQKIKLISKIPKQDGKAKNQAGKPEPKENFASMMSHQGKITQYKILGDKRNQIKRNNYIMHQRDSSLKEEKNSNDIHSMERQLQRLNELEEQEHILNTNEISIIERNLPQNEVLILNEISLDHTEQLTNQSIRCLQGQGQVNTRRKILYNQTQTGEIVNKERLNGPPSDQHPRMMIQAFYTNGQSQNIQPENYNIGGTGTASSKMNIAQIVDTTFQPLSNQTGIHYPIQNN